LNQGKVINNLSSELNNQSDQMDKLMTLLDCKYDEPDAQLESSPSATVLPIGEYQCEPEPQDFYSIHKSPLYH
jgi:hypothetical protein